jgi:hypothetical protein
MENLFPVVATIIFSFREDSVPFLLVRWHSISQGTIKVVMRNGQFKSEIETIRSFTVIAMNQCESIRGQKGTQTESEQKTKGTPGKDEKEKAEQKDCGLGKLAVSV